MATSDITLFLCLKRNTVIEFASLQAYPGKTERDLKIKFSEFKKGKLSQWAVKKCLCRVVFNAIWEDIYKNKEYKVLAKKAARNQLRNTKWFEKNITVIQGHENLKLFLQSQKEKRHLQKLENSIQPFSLKIKRL